ncbi:MAG: molybdopterin-dependent oxidoreductase [Alphaproteobacteria bacterium]
MTTEAVRTTCPYCGVGCGLIATPQPDGRVDIRPDPDHPANLGRICSKGAALEETIGLDGRLLYPLIAGRRVGWDAAIDRVAQGFRNTIDRFGPDSVAFYVSGQLLTEDYYVANKLMKGFIGSANIDTNSRLCMSSSVAGHRRAFGADIVPGNYEDLEEADLLVLVGSNAAWCHPVLYQRMMAAREKRRSRMVVIDPRRTVTCDDADLHLAVHPGTDVALWSGLLMHLIEAGVADYAFTGRATAGLDEALAAAALGPVGIDEVARTCGLEPGDVAAFYDWFARTARTVTLYSQGVNQSSAGTDKVNAIVNCHLLTGRIGTPGAGPFSLTGQPNAMGGREVGGLATQLAAHMNLEDANHRSLVRTFWNAPVVADKPGLKAVDLFAAIGRGEVKAVWIMSTNPAVSLPDAGSVATALAKCDLVVVSDCVERTDTTAFAHVLLPALAWGEKDGTVTNSERRISRQRAFLPPPGEARPDWWIVTEVAKHMGFGAGFDYRTPADIFREHAALSGYCNNGTRDFDISGLADLDDAAFDALAPVQWPVEASRLEGTARMLGDGRFYHADRRARFVAVSPRPPAHAVDDVFPLILNTGRVRDHWHTMTRTGASPVLSAHIDEPFVAVHPSDAARFGLTEGSLARIASRWGDMVARVRLDDAQAEGSVFAPIHWNGRFASRGLVDAVVNPVVDPISGQPEAKHTPVALSPCTTAWQALALSRRPLDVGGASYWARARGRGFWRTRIAGDAPPGDWDGWARSLLESGGAAAEWISYSDPASGRYRYARISAGRLDACLFVAAGPVEGTFDWIARLFSAETIEPLERAALLSGRLLAGAADTGPIVCACFSVGRNQIEAAIAQGGLASVEEIGATLGAGTNCGSCKPELRNLLTFAEKLTVPVGE